MSLASTVRLAALLACLLGVLAINTADAACGNKVPKCPEQINRDVVFLVDASESMDPNRFYGEMLDYLQNLWCALNSDYVNRGTVITFGKEVRQQLEFKPYTAAQWFTAVNNLRSDTSLCCSCCTPTADAFRLARQVLLDNQLVGSSRRTLIATISDGDPWSAEKNGAGIHYKFPKVNPARYRYQIVPQEAALLKQAIPETILFFVGVPNKHGKPPAVGYMAGVPNPSLAPKKKKKGYTQCIARRRRKWCAKIKFPPFPIVSQPVDQNLFSSNTWDVDELLDSTAQNMCREILTSAPSQAPTQTPKFESLDLYLFLDRSRSMQWHADVCRTAPGSNAQAIDPQVCWQLFLRFAETLVQNATQIRYPLPSSPAFGWQGERGSLTKGVRVWIYGFACADQQSTPVVERIGENINTQAAFNEAMQKARELTPDGGTCPSAAVERALGQIMKHDLAARPFKAAVLSTDGVVYDDPSLAFKGLHALGVLTWALGIAIPNNGNNYGLTQNEIKTQRQQLLNFVNGDKSHRLNFGAEGLLVLDQIASGIIANLPTVVEETFPRVVSKPYYCGFTNNERCLNTEPDTFNTAQYCKWIPNNWDKFEGKGRCMDKTWCGWPMADCRKDKFCKWTGNKCVKK